MNSAPLTVGAVSMAASVIIGWLWVENHFIPRADAEEIHRTFTAALAEAVTELKKSDRTSYLDLKIDSAKAEMAFMRGIGVDADNQETYDLLKFSVEHMTSSLLKMDDE